MAGMRLEYYALNKLKQELLNIIGKHLDLGNYHIFFFGSRVSGGGNDRSDIDVGIDGKEPISLAALAAIEADIEELPTLYTIQIVDFKRVSERFRDVALSATEALAL